jgi:hypothetical protein
MVVVAVRVIECQPLPYLSCLDPDDTVFTCAVSRIPAEDFRPYGALLDGLPGKGLLDDVREKIMAALARAEVWTREDALLLCANSIS